jgi:hypothetical protein
LWINKNKRYIDDVLSINNSRFAEFLPLIYPPELEVKETTDTASSASFLDLYLEFDDSGQLSTDVNTICRRSWYIAAHVWKIYDFKIEVVPFIINFSTDLTTVVISRTGILMTFYLSIILDLQNFFHWYILQRWKLKRPQIPLRPHHFWTYTSNLTTVVKSVLKFMINETKALASWIFLSFTSFWRNSDSYEYKNKSARRRAQFVPIGMPTTYHWYILQSWKLKRPPIQLRPHHFWTCTSNLTTVVNSVLKFMINGMTSILKS